MVVGNSNTFTKAFTKEDIDKLIKELEPKDILFTSDKEVYDKLIKLPFRNESNVNLNSYVEKNQILIIDKKMLL